MKINIIYLSTNVYNQYFYETFLPSVHNFLPGVKKKLTIISDGLQEYKGFKYRDIEDTDVKYIPHMPYPLVTLLKYQWLAEYADTDYEYFAFFDADTKIIVSPSALWNRLKEEIEEYDMIINDSPHMWRGKGILTDNRVTNRESKAFIPDNLNTEYSQTSCFLGKTNILKQLNGIIDDMIKYDLNHNMFDRYIPPYQEENYFNRFLNVENRNGNIFKILKKHLSTVPDHAPFMERSKRDNNVFCWQKWQKGDKYNIRNKTN